jgi:hypothetical protein
LILCARFGHESVDPLRAIRRNFIRGAPHD